MKGLNGELDISRKKKEFIVFSFATHAHTCFFNSLGNKHKAHLLSDSFLLLFLSEKPEL